jgi:hypothetical protein
MAKGGKKGGGQDDRLHLIAEVLADAHLFGQAVALEKHGLTERSLRRYKHRLRTDGHLASLVRQKTIGLEETVRQSRLELMAATQAKLLELVAKTDVDHIRDLVGCLKIVGELQLVSGALSGQLPAPAREGGPTPPPAAGNGGTPSRAPPPAGTNGNGSGADTTH